MTRRQVLVNGTPLQLAGDASASRAVIVLQEAFGVNDHIRTILETYAAGGYFAVAPELFHRAGSPEVPYDNFPQAMGALTTLEYDGLHDDLLATAQYLNAQGFSRSSIATVGYCMGGSVAFFAATLGVVGAAASYYGGGVETGRFGLPSLIDLAPSLRCAWLGLYGDLDKGIPVEQVEGLRAAAARAPVATEVVRYADAEHGFNCDGRPAVFNDGASHDATQRTFAFFQANLTDK